MVECRLRFAKKIFVLLVIITIDDAFDLVM